MSKTSTAIIRRQSARLRPWISKINHLATGALNTLLPPRCIASGDIVEAQGLMRADYWQEIRFIAPPCCAQCGLPFPFNPGEYSLCGGCLEYPPVFDKARSAIVYNDASRLPILNFKYGDKLHTLGTFGMWVHQAYVQLQEQADVVIPVPLHRKRLWQRRYNQAALLSSGLAKKAGLESLPDALVRTRHTKQQKGLNRRQRKDNVRGAFAIRADAVAQLHNKNAVLVDDVYTSGATLNECTRVLKAAGVQKVFVVTIARVIRDDFI